MNQVPLDRDFIQTLEDFFFCIIGYIHPSDRIKAYLKYIPSEFGGKWKFKNQKLRRVLPYYSAQAVLNTFKFLENEYPQYLFFDKFSEMIFSGVPKTKIKRIFSTQQELKKILGSCNLDSLQKKLKAFIYTLSELSDLSISAFGITGSILLNIHSVEFSDLDITIHGVENALKIRNVLKDIFEFGHPKISRLPKEVAERWGKDKANRFGLKKEDTELLFKRKWNMGLFEDIRFSIHPIKNLNEIDERYGDNKFSRLGEIEILAKVSEAKGLFMPSKYIIKDVEVIKGELVEDIKQVVSYEGLFDSSVEENEYVKAKGQLEKVTNNLLNKEYYQIVIGSNQGSREEYIIKL